MNKQERAAAAAAAAANGGAALLMLLPPSPRRRHNLEALLATSASATFSLLYYQARVAPTPKYVGTYFLRPPPLLFTWTRRSTKSQSHESFFARLLGKYYGRRGFLH